MVSSENAGLCRVLHVDNDDKILRTVSKLAERSGMKIDSSSNYLEGLEAAIRENYDALILDGGIGEDAQGNQYRGAMIAIAAVNNGYDGLIVMYTGDPEKVREELVGLNETLESSGLNEVICFLKGRDVEMIEYLKSRLNGKPDVELCDS